MKGIGAQTEKQERRHTRFPGEIGMAPMKKRGKKNGFTLLEIIIVLVLVTLILGLSTVYFAGFLPGVKLDATGRELAALIRHARSLARRHGEVRTVVIDLDARTYGMEDAGGKPFPPHVLVMIVDPFSGEIHQGKYPLVFRPGGGGGGGAIVLSGGKKKIRLEMDPVTGVVLIRGGR